MNNSINDNFDLKCLSLSPTPSHMKSLNYLLSCITFFIVPITYELGFIDFSLLLAVFMNRFYAQWVLGP